MKTILLASIIGLAIITGAKMDNDAFKLCEKQSQVSTETCLAAHGIR